jgi:tRNA threonylcarbamoyladenosine biosynthesis protein TsaB
MYNTLIIDTALPQLSLALICENGDERAIVLEEEFKHAKRITLEIEKLLKSCNLCLSDLNYIAINEGPGSFTGLRVGSSTAKGLCFGLKIPLLTIKGIEAMAMAIYQENQNDYSDIFILIDARRENYFYTQVSKGEVIIPISFDANQNIQQHIAGCERPMIIKSDEKSKNKLSAKFMIAEVKNKIASKDFADISLFEPNYYLNNYQKK